MKKEDQGYQSEGAVYVTEKIYSLILQLHFRRFYGLIFAPPKNLGGASIGTASTGSYKGLLKNL